MTAAELVEQGVRAYTSGKLQDAARCWRDALALDPENARAVTYLELLGGSYQSAVASLARGASLGGPAGRSDPRSGAPATGPGPCAAAAPVRLPAPVGADGGSDLASASPAAGSERPLSPQPAQPARAPAPTPPESSSPGASGREARRAPAWVSWDAAQEGGDGASPPRSSEPARFARVWDPDAPDEASPAHEPSPGPERPSDGGPWLPASSGAEPGAELSGRAPFSDLVPPAPFSDLATPAPFSDLATATAPGDPPGGEPPDRDSPWDDRPSRTPAIVLEGGGGLDLSSVAEPSTVHPLVPELLAPPAPPVRAGRTEIEVWMDGARELFALGDFSGSLEMIERILKVNPAHEEARAYLEQNETTLISMYESKLGPPDHAPRLAIKPEEVMWLNLDHRAGFLLAQIDGAVTYDDLFALSGLPRLDTARILAALLQERVIV